MRQRRKKVWSTSTDGRLWQVYAKAPRIDLFIPNEIHNKTIYLSKRKVFKLCAQALPVFFSLKKSNNGRFDFWSAIRTVITFTSNYLDGCRVSCKEKIFNINNKMHEHETLSRTSDTLNNERFQTRKRFSHLQFMQVYSAVILVCIFLFDDLQSRFLICLLVQLEISSTLQCDTWEINIH